MCLFFPLKFHGPREEVSFLRDTSPEDVRGFVLICQKCTDNLVQGLAGFSVDALIVDSMFSALWDVQSLLQLLSCAVVAHSSRRQSGSEGVAVCQRIFIYKNTQPRFRCRPPPMRCVSLGPTLVCALGFALWRDHLYCHCPLNLPLLTAEVGHN